MSNQKAREMFAKAVCMGARSGIVAAWYLAAFLAILGMAAMLPDHWSPVGITALLLVTGLPLLGKWPGRGFRLESVGLGYQPDGQPNLQPAVPIAPKDVSVRSKPILGVILGCR